MAETVPGDGEVLRPVGTHAILKSGYRPAIAGGTRGLGREGRYGNDYGGLYGNAGFAQSTGQGCMDSCWRNTAIWGRVRCTARFYALLFLCGKSHRGLRSFPPGSRRVEINRRLPGRCAPMTQEQRAMFGTDIPEALLQHRWQTVHGSVGRCRKSYCEIIGQQVCGADSC